MRISGVYETNHRMVYSPGLPLHRQPEHGAEFFISRRSLPHSEFVHNANDLRTITAAPARRRRAGAAVVMASMGMDRGTAVPPPDS